MNNQAERLKALRQQIGLNQQQVADKVGKSRPRIATYETQANVRIPADVLQKLAKLYKTTPDYIEQGTAAVAPKMGPVVTANIPVLPSNGPTLPAYMPAVGHHPIDYISGRSVRPVVVTIDRYGRENVVLVPVKAQAGYLTGYSNPDFIQSLRVYSIPGCEDGTYRIFEVEGDSMVDTIRNGDMVVTRYLDDWRSLKADAMYVIVAKEGVVVKRVKNMLEKAAGIMILSDNPQFQPDFIPAEDIREIWEAKALISQDLSRKPGDMLQELNNLRIKIDQMNPGRRY